MLDTIFFSRKILSERFMSQSHFETNKDVSNKDTNPSQSPSSNPGHKAKETNSTSELEQDQHSSCFTLLHGLSIKGARTLLINQEA